MSGQSSNSTKSSWTDVASLVITLILLVVGGGFFYNAIWLRPDLTYNVLPTYDLGSRAFSGLVIENRGRSTLTDIDVSISGIEATIEEFNMPGAHEPAEIVAGGKGQREVRVRIPRLSPGASISLYMLTSRPISLEEKKSLYVSSKETPGVDSKVAEADPWRSLFKWLPK